MTETMRLIVEVTPISGERISMDGPWPTEYVRYSADNWTVTMGESDEQVYACEDLEKAYQLWEKQTVTKEICPLPIGTIKKLVVNGVKIDSIKITESEWIIPYAKEKCGVHLERTSHIILTDLS